MTKRAEELRQMGDDELKAKVTDLRKEAFQMVNAISSKKEDVKPYQIQQKRRDVARIKTILGQRERQKGAR